MSEFSSDYSLEESKLNTVLVDGNGQTENKADEKENTNNKEIGSDDKPQKATDNIIPMAKLRNGFLAAYGFMATKVKDTAEELNKYETVQNLKLKTQEAITAATPVMERARDAAVPVIAKAKETAVPIWEKTCEVTQNVYGKTVEATSKAAENFKPTAEKIQANASAGFKTVSDITVEQVSKLATMAGLDKQEQEPHAPSALDTATKGGPMNV